MDKKIEKPLMPMPIKVKPFQHQITAFNFVCRLFGLVKGGDDSKPAVISSGCGILAEMGCG